VALARFITAHTPNYTSAAARLVDSAYKHGVDVQAIPYEDRGSWAQNTQAKAGIIHDFVRSCRGPVIWVDADSTFHNRLDDDDLSNWADCYDVCLPRATTRSPSTFYTGTMWFRNGAADRRLLARWAGLCMTAEPYQSDEFLLEKARIALQESGATVAYGFMPCKWSWHRIHDMRRRYPVEEQDAIIAHEIGNGGHAWIKNLTEAQKKEMGLWDYSNSTSPAV